jgi:hypothetical protein
MQGFDLSMHLVGKLLRTTRTLHEGGSLTRLVFRPQAVIGGHERSPSVDRRYGSLAQDRSDLSTFWVLHV